ncbi:MAG: hypothetical protein ACI4CX_06130 [Candidatus Weimeria sp.]
MKYIISKIKRLADKRVLLIIIALLAAVIVFGIVHYYNYGNNSLRIKVVGDDDDGFWQMDFDFRNGKCYKFTNINITPISDDAKKRYEKAEKKIFSKNNKACKGYISKVWFDNNVIMTYEVSDFDLMDESDIKKYSIEGIKGKSRRDILKHISFFEPDDSDEKFVIE